MGTKNEKKIKEIQESRKGWSRGNR